jgi:hypothetical protein
MSATAHELAVHEAGHATMAHGLGHVLNAVEVRGDGTGLALTGCTGERIPIADEIATLETFAPETRDRVLRERLWVALAGDAAVGILLTGRTHWDGESDRAVIHAVCMSLERAPWHPDAFPRVQALLRASWPAIEALAGELDRLHRVEGPRVAELLTPHLAAGAWTEECHR